ncbi:glycosyltransferase family 4 protein [Stackebrandtia nassauensis]|nr:glycosyltransferase family 4 protein [Stackebrandtia nassauensis]
MKIGIVSPYSFAHPGGVQGHIRDLAETLIETGHEVSVLAPGDRDEEVPSYVVSAGRAIPVKYNGSVARLSFGPLAATRVRRWLRRNDFDVLHVHEPLSPSLSLLACVLARSPVVATFHTAMPRSRALAAGRGIAQLVLEKITARIAVSAHARRLQVEHLGGGATEIPNGVKVSRFAEAPPLPGWPGDGGCLGFVGRFDEPRKGFAILLDAFAALVPEHPGLRLLVLGPGDTDKAVAGLDPEVRGRIDFLGMASDEVKARMLRSVDIYVAPNTGGESFGMILTEAMAAGTPIVASDLNAFRRVLDDGAAGALFPVGDADALAETIAKLLPDNELKKSYVAKADELLPDFDWSNVAERVLEVYTAAVEATGGTAARETPPAPVPL